MNVTQSSQRDEHSVRPSEKATGLAAHARTVPPLSEVVPCPLDAMQTFEAELERRVRQEQIAMVRPKAAPKAAQSAAHYGTDAASPIGQPVATLPGSASRALAARDRRRCYACDKRLQLPVPFPDKPAGDRRRPGPRGGRGCLLHAEPAARQAGAQDREHEGRGRFPHRCGSGPPTLCDPRPPPPPELEPGLTGAARRLFPLSSVLCPGTRQLADPDDPRERQERFEVVAVRTHPFIPPFIPPRRSHSRAAARARRALPSRRHVSSAAQKQ